MPDEANLIHPPVTYGQVPDGGQQDYPAEVLVSGQTYDLVLWRVLPDGSEHLDPPAGSTGGCIATVDNACVVAVREFIR